MMNSLRSLRNSAAKKRAKASASGSEPDPDSPDSAVKLEPNLDSSSQTSPSLTSPLSDSSLSSLYSPTTPTINGTKSRYEFNLICLSIDIFRGNPGPVNPYTYFHTNTKALFTLNQHQ